MSAGILHLDAAGKWDQFVDRLEGGVYFTAGYHSACEDAGARAEVFVYEDDGELLFYPYLRRVIDRVAAQPVTPVLYDIETAHGYTGPLATTKSRTFLNAAWAAFEAHCRESSVVAEFVRFNPFLENWSIAANNMIVSRDRETVVMDLSGGEIALWNSYSASQRNMIRKATAHGLEAKRVGLPEGLAVFEPLYELTMKRVGAGESYRYSPSYYDRLIGSLGEQVSCFAVFEGAEAVAAALFLNEPNVTHYHLSGSNERARAFAPNNLLLHAVAIDCIKHQRRWFHLGGGRTNAADDSLMRFKQSFSDHRRDFMIGRAVHNHEKYSALCDCWAKVNAAKAPPQYFFKYRL